jgi:hypothetical protein
MFTAASVAITDPASANTPNPLPSTTTSIVNNADGTVTVTLNGQWSWGMLAGSSTQARCDTRFGVGWTVDWAGISPIATAPGARGAILIKSSQLYFHVSDVDMVAAGNVYPFTGPCTDDELALDPTGPSGPWSASHTYPSENAIPQRICANFYDLHGTPGAIARAADADPLANPDNSIRVNSFDPLASDGYCYSRPHTDVVAPDVTGAPDRPANAAGWYDAPVTITWTSIDPEPSSGAPNQPAPTVASTEGVDVTYASPLSCDPVLNCARGSLALSIDTTPPNVSYVGNAGTYTVDQHISISCVADDPLSGVAASTCTNIDADAYNLVGTHTYTATATDAAGNTATTTTTVNVVVTTTSLSSVTKTLVTDPAISRALAATLAKQQPNAYIKQVQAQAGKKISRPTANLLISMARTL